MALRWRIRHKLLLGLGLVVGIMALLLGGGLLGLWSYYLTTISIRSKLDELKKAEDLKEAVTRLVAPHNVAHFLRHPDAKITLEVKNRLDDYESEIQKTQSQKSDRDLVSEDQEWVLELRKDIDNFDSAMRRVAGVATVKGPAANQGDSEGSLELEEEEKKEEETGFKVVLSGVVASLGWPQGGPGPAGFALIRLAAAENPVRREAAKLTRDAGDLRNHINEQLATFLRESRRHYQLTLWIVVPSSVGGLLLMASLLLSFYTWVFNPIRDLESGVKRVARGDFDKRIDLHSGDEMEDLAAAFNDMMRRLHELYSDLARQVNERSRQLVRSERLASVGFLAAGVAHEINNPLASIAFCAEALETRLADLLRAHPASGGRQSPVAGSVSDRSRTEHEVFAKYLKMIQEEAFRCKSITERLLAFSRTGEPKRETTDLSQLVQSVLDITQHLQNCKGKQIILEKMIDRGGRIIAPVNADEIKSVVLNLVVNALDSMDEGGKLTIQLIQKDGMAEMRFTDTGCGMTQEVLENIFEPFFTRSRTGKGTGLGLTISHRIISHHGGDIEASSPGPNQGSTFVVRLPLDCEEPGLRPPSEGQRAA